MDNQIDLRIELDEQHLARDPFFLQNLEKDLQREIRTPISHETRKASRGAMGPELVTAIELSGLAVTSLGMIWTILQIRYRGEVTIEKVLPDGTKITIKKSHLTDEQLRMELRNLEMEAKANKIRKLLMKLTGS